MREWLSRVRQSLRVRAATKITRFYRRCCRLSVWYYNEYYILQAAKKLAVMIGPLYRGHRARVAVKVLRQDVCAEMCSLLEEELRRRLEMADIDVVLNDMNDGSGSLSSKPGRSTRNLNTSSPSKAGSSPTRAAGLSRGAVDIKALRLNETEQLEYIRTYASDVSTIETTSYSTLATAPRRRKERFPNIPERTWQEQALAVAYLTDHIPEDSILPYHHIINPEGEDDVAAHDEDVYSNVMFTNTDMLSPEDRAVVAHHLVHESNDYLVKKDAVQPLLARLAQGQLR